MLLSYGLKSEAADQGLLKYSLNHHLRNNSQRPPDHQNLLLKILKNCKQQGTFSPERLSADALTFERYHQKMPQQSNRAQIKNLSDLTHKICPKILRKVTPVTSMTNIFLKTSEGQLFPERLKDIFSRVFIHVFRNFQDCYSFFYYGEEKYHR